MVELVTKEETGHGGVQLGAATEKVGGPIYLVYRSHFAYNLQASDVDDDWHVFRYSKGWYAHECLSTCVA